MIHDKLSLIQTRIAAAAAQCGRDPSEVTLVVVAKTQSPVKVQEVIDAGAGHIAENYIQEARQKIDRLGNLPVQWHFIGHLQTNKAKYAVRMFDWIHTVDSTRLARELNHQAGRIGKRQKVLVQVNVSGEKSKSGISPAQAQDLVLEISTMSHLEATGLMTIPPYFEAPQKSRPVFAQLRALRDDIRSHLPADSDNKFCELSMGMTGDFEVAIEQGATLVRIGTAIFGERS